MAFECTNVTFEVKQVKSIKPYKNGKGTKNTVSAHCTLCRKSVKFSSIFQLFYINVVSKLKMRHKQIILFGWNSTDIILLRLLMW